MIDNASDIRPLNESDLDFISGGEGEVRKAFENAGVEFINAVEDATEYVHGFFVGVGRAFSNGR